MRAKITPLTKTQRAAFQRIARSRRCQDLEAIDLHCAEIRRNARGARDLKGVVRRMAPKTELTARKVPVYLPEKMYQDLCRESERESREAGQRVSLAELMRTALDSWLDQQKKARSFAASMRKRRAK